MATIYLVDNNKDSIKIKKAINIANATAIARGLLWCAEETPIPNELEEYWFDADKYWLQYKESKVYCIVTK